jgi:hypothetical protein
MHGQHGSEPLQIKASPGTAFTEFAPSERAEARDHRVLDTDRGSDREIISVIKGFLRDLRNKGFIECEREEGGRGTIADPEWKPCVANVSVAMRDGNRLCAVTLSPAPVHFKRLALVYCHYYLGGCEILAFDRARSAVSERHRSDTQVFVVCKPPGWLARCKVDQVMLQMLTPDRSHWSLPPAGEGPQFFARYAISPNVRCPSSMFYPYDRTSRKLLLLRSSKPL